MAQHLLRSALLAAHCAYLYSSDITKSMHSRQLLMRDSRTSWAPSQEGPDVKDAQSQTFTMCTQGLTRTWPVTFRLGCGKYGPVAHEAGSVALAILAAI